MTIHPNKNISFLVMGLCAFLALSFISLGCGGKGIEETVTTTSSSTTTTLPHAAVPTFALAAGSYEAAYITVTIESTTPSAEIYYTLDGSDPTATSTRYAAAFTIE